MAYEINAENTGVENKSNCNASTGVIFGLVGHTVSLVWYHVCAITISGREKTGISVVVLTTITVNKEVPLCVIEQIDV
jgi:hypothetical protein